MPERNRILLHVCCAPCCTHAIERLRAGYDVTLFFSNSNLFPPEEYAKRLQEADRLARICQCCLVEDSYDHDAWLAFVKGLEDEREGGKRCRKCFEFNLTRAAAYARGNGFAAFTTTLTISPHKRAADIFAIGQRLGDFLDVDFKKQDGFRRSVELSHEFGLYRQGYCGCEFSLRR